MVAVLAEDEGTMEWMAEGSTYTHQLTTWPLSETIGIFMSTSVPFKRACLRICTLIFVFSFLYFFTV